jgi:hypothetical protein
MCHFLLLFVAQLQYALSLNELKKVEGDQRDTGHRQLCYGISEVVRVLEQVVCISNGYAKKVTKCIF